MRKFILPLAFVFLINPANSQNVGIGTTIPKARLHVADSAVVFTGAASLPATAGLPPVTGAGTRMMWYPNKAAFRAGRVSGTQWNEAGVGLYSTAFGLNTIASGDYAASFGNVNIASGSASFTAGQNNSVSGMNAAAIGERLNAQSYSSFVIGRYNVLGGTPTTWQNNDPAFVIGNGYTFVDPDNVLQTVRRNAFSVDKSGNTEIKGTTTVDGFTHLKSGAIIEGSAELVGSAYLRNTTMVGTLTIDAFANISKGLALNRTIVTIPHPSTFPYEINTQLGPFIEIRIVIPEGGPLRDIKLSNGVTIGQLVVLYTASENTLPSLALGFKYGIPVLEDNEPATNANVAGNMLLSLEDSIICLMWTGSYWTELFRSHN